MAPSKDVAAFLSNDEADLAITVSVVRYPVTLNHCRYGSDTFAVFYDAACREPVRTVEDYSAARHAVVSFGGNNKSVVERALHVRVTGDRQFFLGQDRLLARPGPAGAHPYADR